MTSTYSIAMAIFLILFIQSETSVVIKANDSPLRGPVGGGCVYMISVSSRVSGEYIPKGERKRVTVASK